MDMQAALRKRLLDATQVAILAGSRVSWVIRPQGSALPAITLQTISGSNETSFLANDQLKWRRVQVDAWGKTYASVRALADAAIPVLESPGAETGIRFDRSFLDNESDLGEDTDAGFVHRISLDFIIWYAAL